jgi:hypothetical protein
MFFEQARKQAEEDFEANSRDAQVCVSPAHPTQGCAGPRQVQPMLTA